MTTVDDIMDAAPPAFGIVGCGRMGSALARLFGGEGFRVLLTSRTRRSAAELARQIPTAVAGSLEQVASAADVVVFATPIEVTCAEIAPRVRELLAGKTVIDVSNPGFADGGPPLSEAHGALSGAERVARLLPDSHVVKALNCVAAKRVGDVAEGVLKVTVPFAGDDVLAKSRVGLILEIVGFHIVDAGPLSSSRWIEYLPQLLVRRGLETPGGLLLDEIDFLEEIGP